LLLAATVRSFAHMPLGISDRNSANINLHLGEAHEHCQIGRFITRFCKFVHRSTALAMIIIEFGHFIKFRHLKVSVEHDPVTGLRSNRILHFRTGPGLEWILKKWYGLIMHFCDSNHEITRSSKRKYNNINDNKLII